jgi:hypothetical protein
MPTLQVLVDGAPMPEADARAFWARFSEHMEANKGDLAGFAKREGYASVHPAMGPAGARLMVSKTAAQTAYRTVSNGEPAGGSSGHQSKGKRSAPGGKSRKK